MKSERSSVASKSSKTTAGTKPKTEDKLLLDIDYKRPGDDDQNISLSANYILFAVQNVHPQGLDGQKRRTFGRLQRKLEDAEQKKIKRIELAADEKDLLRKVFADCRTPAADARYFMMLEDEIERVCKP